MSQKFLKAEWRKLILVNFLTDERTLTPYLPAKTELDYWDNQLYVSLVGFMFLNTSILGIPAPFHRSFPEVNLRFYVRYREGNTFKRGVVFIKEFVPKPMVSFIANTFFSENYETLPMKKSISETQQSVHWRYDWKKNNRWNYMEAIADPQPSLIIKDSKEEFITQHFWGYNKINNERTTEYNVAHPLWQRYEMRNYKMDCRFEELYGKNFAFLNDALPVSVMMAEGSEIAIFNKKIIE